MLHIEKINYNDFDDLISNTYIIFDDKVAIIVDPGSKNNSVNRFLETRGLTLSAILLTHGHIDHIRGVDGLVEKYGATVYLHQDDECMLLDSYVNCSTMLGEDMVVNTKPTFIKDGEKLKLFQEDEIVVIHTPFHTKGSCCYYFRNNKWLFSGDTLFKESIGRDDLPNSIPSKTYESLKKIKKLPPETKIYPGHGANSTLESELMLNHFLIK